MGSHKCDPATDNNTFLNGGACGVHSVFNACFLLFHLNFCSGPDVNDGNTTGEFCEAFLQFLAVVVGCCVFNLSTNLVDTSLDGFGCAFTFNDGCVILVNHNTFRTAEVVQCDIFEVNSEIFGDDAPVCQDGNVFEHRFSTVPVAGCLNGGTTECSTNFVDDNGCECFAFNLFSDDQQRFALLCGPL